MRHAVLHLSWITALVLASIALAQSGGCCTIVGLEEKRQAITAIERASGKLFRMTVTDPAAFKTARMCETFDAPLAEAKKDGPLAADFGKADPKKPCCTLATEVGGAGRALGVRKYEVEGVDVILTELKRTSGDTVTARWQYCNSTSKPVKFKAEGCTGMGCTYTLAEEMYLLDGGSRTKHPVARDTSNKAMAERYPPTRLQVGPGQLLTTWAKFNAPPAATDKITVVIPGTTEPLEDVPIAP